MSNSSRVVLVTGGLGGIGESICVELAEAGWQVAATYCSSTPEKVQEQLAEFLKKGLNIRAFYCDVSDFSSCQSCVAQVKSQMGMVAALVNNAGITQDKSFRKMTFEDFDAVIRCNLYSVFNMSKNVIDDMIAMSWGRIVNVSSVNGEKGAFGQVNYASSKSGMYGFSRSLALEVAKKGITVNTVSPGYIGTKMVTAIPEEILDTKILPLIPMGRLGKPKEVASLVKYLLSEEASFITGSNLSINGGQNMR